MVTIRLWWLPNSIGKNQKGHEMNDEYDHYRYSSIMDVVSILDSASLTSNELVPQYRAMQIANRALIAHHSMEKGFKDRLKKEGLTYPTSGSQGHDLGGLLRWTPKFGQVAKRESRS